MKFLVYYISVFFIVSGHAHESNSDDVNPVIRQLSYEFNPGCDIPHCENSSAVQINLIHVTADGPDDSIHYLWSTWKLPSIIVARTAHNASLIVNWTELHDFKLGAIKFSEPPVYSIGLVVEEVWEFIDEKDQVDMSASMSSLKPLNLSSLRWTNANETLQLVNNLVSAFPKSSNNESVFLDGGTFGVKFSVSGEEIPSVDSPHLVYSANSTQFTIVLNNFVPESKKSRFAMKFISVAPLISSTKVWDKKVDDTINDEYSPGVFSVVKVIPPCSGQMDNCTGVFSWKPVTYTGEKPIVANSSDASLSVFEYENFTVSCSIVESYFGGLPNVEVSQISWNLTFGTSGDGFYDKTRYSSWTAMVGLGKSVSEKISKVAIIVIAIGLGAPSVIMIVGFIYLGIARCRRKDDDLFLSHESIN